MKFALLVANLLFTSLGTMYANKDSSEILLYVLTEDFKLIIHRKYELDELLKRNCRAYLPHEQGIVIRAGERKYGDKVIFHTYKSFPGLKLYFWPNHNLKAIIFTLPQKDKKNLELFNLADNRLFLFDKKGELEVFIKFKKGGLIKERINYYDGDTCLSEEILDYMVYWTEWNTNFKGKRGVARDTIE